MFLYKPSSFNYALPSFVPKTSVASSGPLRAVTARRHPSSPSYSICIIIHTVLDSAHSRWTGLRLGSPSLKPSCWCDYVIRNDKSRLLSLSLSLSLCTPHSDYVHSMA